MIRVVLERDSAEQEGDDTAHAQSVREEVRRVRHKCNDAALDLRVGGQVRVLETERAHEAERDTEQHGYEEREQEDADTVEETREVNVLAVEVRERPG